MWVVKFDDNRRHSAWAGKSEALHQARVLVEAGLIKVYRSRTNLENFIEYDPTVSCENGYYYV